MLLQIRISSVDWISFICESDFFSSDFLNVGICISAFCMYNRGNTQKVERKFLTNTDTVKS